MAGTKEEHSLTREQSYFVVKSNELIQKTRYSMNAQQLKLTMYLVSKVKPQDDELMVYQFDIAQFCRVCNIDAGNGKNLNDVRKALKDLADKSVWFEVEDGREVLIRWFDRVVLDKRRSKFEVRFHSDMFPFLLNLSERYTQYSLENVLPMKSKYGLRLYELLKSYQNLGSVTFSIDELKRRLDCEKYDRYPDFRVNVLERAMQDINGFSDIAVDYVALKSGRSFTDILFTIKSPQGDESYRRHLSREVALEG